MDFLVFLQGLGSVSIFASRAFLPAFVTSLSIRFGSKIPGLDHAGLLARVGDVPTWFTSDIALVTLGLLTAVEFIAQRSPEVKIVLDRVHDFLKAGMSALTYLGVLNATDRGAVQAIIHQASVIDVFPIMLVASGTWLATQARAALFRPLEDADDDDHLGLQSLVRWIGDLWGIVGPVALIVFPLLTIGALCLAVILVFVIERRIEARAQKFKVECDGCKALIHPSASFCPSCLFEIASPRAITLLGQATASPADLESLPFKLVALRRCPVCATKFPGRGITQKCGACEHQLMDDPQFARDYVAFIDRRVPLVCCACFVLGLVPVIGVIPGVIYYRLAIVAPFQRYIPAGQGRLVRWAVRLGVVGLVAFQWIPVAGGLAVLLMAVINYSAYRTVFRRLPRK